MIAIPNPFRFSIDSILFLTIIECVAKGSLNISETLFLHKDSFPHIIIIGKYLDLFQVFSVADRLRQRLRQGGAGLQAPRNIRVRCVYSIKSRIKKLVKSSIQNQKLWYNNNKCGSYRPAPKHIYH